MSTKAGALLWNRMQITVPTVTTAFDTGLTQLNRGFANSSGNEPPFGVVSTTAPAPGAAPASRVMVTGLAPLGVWTSITVGEPFFNPTTQTVWVTLRTANEVAVVANVLFWNPHTSMGPGSAHTYG